MRLFEFLLIWQICTCRGTLEVYDTPHDCEVSRGDVLFGFVGRVRESIQAECDGGIRLDGMIFLFLSRIFWSVCDNTSVLQ